MKDGELKQINLFQERISAPAVAGPAYMSVSVSWCFEQENSTPEVVEPMHRKEAAGCSAGNSARWLLWEMLNANNRGGVAPGQPCLAQALPAST